MFFRFSRQYVGRFFALCVLLVTLAGCVSAASSVIIDLENRNEVVGTWKGRFEPNAYPRVGSVVILTLKPGGKYDYFIYANKYNGTYRIENGKLVLKPAASDRETVITYYDTHNSGSEKVMKWSSQRGDFTLSRVK